MKTKRKPSDRRKLSTAEVSKVIGSLHLAIGAVSAAARLIEQVAGYDHTLSRRARLAASALVGALRELE